jgi:hypothetical protein
VEEPNLLRAPAPTADEEIVALIGDGDGMSIRFGEHPLGRSLKAIIGTLPAVQRKFLGSGGMTLYEPLWVAR